MGDVILNDLDGRACMFVAEVEVLRPATTRTDMAIKWYAAQRRQHNFTTQCD